MDEILTDFHFVDRDADGLVSVPSSAGMIKRNVDLAAIPGTVVFNS